MRNLSTLGIRLLGILSVYWAASGLAQTLVDIPLLATEWPHGETMSATRALRQSFMSGIGEFIVAGLFAAFLLRRTDWIVSRLRLPDETCSIQIATPEEILRVSLIVVGSVAVITGIPGLLEGLFYLLFQFHVVDSWQLPKGEVNLLTMTRLAEMLWINNFVGSVVKFVLGCVFVTKSRVLASKALSL